MKAAVTGATGFVGRHLVEALRRRQAEVRCLVRDPARAVPLEAIGCTVVAGALSDTAALAALVQGTDVVFHAAGAVAASDEGEFLRVNRDGTGAVASAARAAGVRRVVYVSSLSATGPAEAGRPARADAPPRPVSAYGRSKLAGEDALRRSGAPFAIVRPPSVYGPGDVQFLRLFRAARRGLVPLIRGEQELSFVYAPDLAEALVAVAQADAAAGATYHAAHPEVATQRRFLQSVGEAVGRRPRLLRVPASVLRGALRASGLAARLLRRPTLIDGQKAPELLAEAWTCATDEITRDTGWRAATALAEGLPATRRWYEAHGWL